MSNQLNSKEVYNVLNAFKVFIDDKFEEDVDRIKKNHMTPDAQESFINNNLYIKKKLYDFIGAFITNCFSFDDLLKNEPRILAEIITPMGKFCRQTSKIKVNDDDLQKIQGVIDRLSKYQAQS